MSGPTGGPRSISERKPALRAARAGEGAVLVEERVLEVAQALAARHLVAPERARGLVEPPVARRVVGHDERAVGRGVGARRRGQRDRHEQDGEEECGSDPLAHYR